MEPHIKVWKGKYWVTSHGLSQIEKLCLVLVRPGQFLGSLIVFHVLLTEEISEPRRACTVVPDKPSPVPAQAQELSDMFYGGRPGKFPKALHLGRVSDRSCFYGLITRDGQT